MVKKTSRFYDDGNILSAGSLSFKYYTRPCTLGQLNATISTWVLDIINTSITSRRCVSSKLLSKE